MIPDEALKQSERWHPERKSRDEAHCDERGDLFVGRGCFSYGSSCDGFGRKRVGREIVVGGNAWVGLLSGAAL